MFNTYPQPPHYFPDNQGADLYRLNGGSNDYLIGTYVDVRNESDPSNRAQGQFQNNTLTFYYAYGDSALDEVNLYYHIDKYRHEFIETNLNLNLGFTQMITWAHRTGEADIANFDPVLKELSFGNGDDYDGNDEYPNAKSTALEDKIIYHEYTHAVMDNINSAVDPTSSSEEGAIGEGMPDYTAGAFTGRAQILNWKRDGDPSSWRDMNNPEIGSYSEYTSFPSVEAHLGGEFFSAILWDLRGSAGADSTEIDILVFDALDGISTSPNFQEFLDVMLVADIAAYSGSHVSLIINTFDSWGIDASYTTVSGTINSNTTWSGVTVLTGATYIDNNAVLTVDPGSYVLLEDDVSLVIRPGAKMIAEGTEIHPIHFKRADPDEDWNRIALNSSAGNVMDWCLVEGGYINLSIASKNNAISHSTFRDATFRTMQGWHNQDGSGNAQADISYSLIENSATVGFVAQYIDLDMSYCTIRYNNQAGLYILSGTVDPFHHNMITVNGGSTRDGIEVKNSGTLIMHNTGLTRGYNEVINNGDDEISTSGDLVVGTIYPGSGGYNALYKYYSGTHYLIDNNSGTSVPAYYIYFGAGPLDPDMFDGSVSTTFNLSSDPTSGVPHGYGGQAPAKARPEENSPVSTDDFIAAYNEAENKLGQAEAPLEIRDELYLLYQLAGLSKAQELTNRFNQLALNASRGVMQLYDSSARNAIFKDYATILYGKFLIQNEDYTKVRQWLQTTDGSGLEGTNRRDWLHLKMVTETYHGRYEEAWQTLQEYYAFQELQGEDMEEVKAGYSPFEEDLKIRIEAREGGTTEPDKQTQEISAKDELTLGNYPNPFNPTTNITFTLPRRSNITLVIYDMLGREVARLVDGALPAGEQSVKFDATGLANGIYLYKLRSGNRQIIRKMTLIK